MTASSWPDPSRPGVPRDPESNHTPQPSLAKGEREELAKPLKSARDFKMTPADREQQRRSFARANSGLSDEQLREMMPELFEVGDLTNVLAQMTRERDAALAREARLREALQMVRDGITTADAALLTDTLWVSDIETALDCIDAALASTDAAPASDPLTRRHA